MIDCMPIIRGHSNISFFAFGIDFGRINRILRGAVKEINFRSLNRNTNHNRNFFCLPIHNNSTDENQNGNECENVLHSWDKIEVFLSDRQRIDCFRNQQLHQLHTYLLNKHRVLLNLIST